MTSLQVHPLPGHQAATLPIVALGRVYFWQGGSLWIGRGQGRTDWHDHHAHQIALPLDGTCLFRSEADGGWTEFSGAFVRSHCHHQFEVEGLTVAHVFVEPETLAGRALSRRFGDDDISPLAEPERGAMAAMLMAAYRAGAGDDEMVSTAKAALAVLAGALPAGAIVDARIAKAIEYIRGHIRGPISLADAAAVAALSPGRFRHLFVQETGAAFRAYLLWSRLSVAIACSMAGGSWTDAAHEAGFADSAHLTRTFKRMFGLSPTTLVRQ